MTIKDVAEKAGVSISTVSKALNDTGSVAPETREAIIQIADKLGYRPNLRARSLARKQNGCVMFVASFPEDAAFVNPHIFEIIRGVESALDENGLNLMIKDCKVDSICAFTEDIVQGKSVDAIFFHASVVTKRLASLIRRLEVPHLVIGQPDFESSLCWIDTNNLHSGEMAARELLKHGYESMMYIAGRSDDMISNHRLQGIQNELSLSGMDMGRGQVIYTESTIYSGLTAARKVMKLKNRPRAVICANNAIAFGFMDELRRQGMSIPEDMAVISFDIYPFSRYTEPQLTVVDGNMFSLGREAGRLIIRVMKNPGLEIQSYSTKPKLVSGAST